MLKIFTSLLLLWSSPASGTVPPEPVPAEVAADQAGQTETWEGVNMHEVEMKLWKSAGIVRSALSAELMASYYENNRIHVVLRPLNNASKSWTTEEKLQIEKILNTIMMTENLPFTVEPYDQVKPFFGNVTQIYAEQQTFLLGHSALLPDSRYRDCVEIRITRDTVIKNTDTGQTIGYKDLEPGMAAEIWADQAKLVSDPSELHAAEIHVHKRSALELTKAPLTEVLGTDFSGIAKIEVRYGDGKLLTIKDQEQIKSITEKLRAIQVSVSYDQIPRYGYSYYMKLYKEDSKEPAFVLGSSFMQDNIRLEAGPEGQELNEYMVKLGRTSIPNLLPGLYPGITG